MGGPLGPGNPARIFAPITTPVVRGEAFWIRSGAIYNRYYGPFDLELPDARGVKFGEELGQQRVRLKNLTSVARTVTLSLLPSETPPDG